VKGIITTHHSSLSSSLYVFLSSFAAFTIRYDDCIYEDLLRRRRLTSSSSSSVANLSTSLTSSSSSSSSSSPSNSILTHNFLEKSTNGAALNDYQCGAGNAQTAWANTPQVRTALHVPADSNFFSSDNGSARTCSFLLLFPLYLKFMVLFCHNTWFYGILHKHIWLYLCSQAPGWITS